MRLSTKLFLAVFVSLMLAFTAVSTVLVLWRSEETENNIIERNTVLAEFIAREIEVGYMESRWPFENLHDLAQLPGFLFWWIVDDRGNIYLADKAEFIGTKVTDYVAMPVQSHGNGYFEYDREASRGLFVRPFRAGTRDWNFWLGFSMTQANENRERDVGFLVLLFVAAELAVSLVIFLVVRYFLLPVRYLLRGTRRVAEGNLAEPIEVKSGDELGEVAHSFNDMMKRLKESYGKLESKIGERTSELDKSRLELERKYAELERLNSSLLGRETKVAEMKRHIDDLEKELAALKGK